jgi:hypothetical protein
LPQASVAVQVRVTMVSPFGPVVVTSLDVSVGLGSQVSVTVAVGKCGVVSVHAWVVEPPHWAPVNMITGGVVSTVQVTVRETGVAALPQASVAFQVRICERLQPSVTTLPVEAVGVTVPQSSAAVAVPRAPSICAAVGLQPNIPLLGLPVAEITGAIVSTVQVTVRVAVAWLVQSSVAVQVRVLERLQPIDVIPLSEAVGDTLPLQLSVAEAVPKPALIAVSLGLQPRGVVPPVVPAVSVITGGVPSSFQVTVRVAVAWLQPSTAVQVRVLERLQPVEVIALSEAVGVTVPLQSSVAEAVPNAASMAALVGLQARAVVPPLGPAVSVITGGLVSLTETVFEHIFVQPLLVTVKLRVSDSPQPLPAVTLTV